MKEDFLHYVWLNKKLDLLNLTTVSGDKIQIIHSGNFLQQAGPDFFNAQIVIGNQKWAGNIEIHLKSSDWYAHHHEKDEAYNNVILHVVWQHDTPIYRKDNSEIPVLELQHFVSKNLVNNYNKLSISKQWIYCENHIQTIDNSVLNIWKEKLFLERLQRKAQFIFSLLEEIGNDWEAVLFLLLAKNFGLNTNGETFLQVAKSISFPIVRKEAVDEKLLEALFFGQANMLPETHEDMYINDLKSWYEYLQVKYKITTKVYDKVQFFKHRPDNFPTIRLAQLAMLYHKQRNLFSQIIETNDLEKLTEIFTVSVSEYWKTHYNFDVKSSFKEKQLSKSFINLLVINTVIPIKFAYANSQGKENIEELITLVSEIPAEKNTIIDKFKLIGLPSQSAFDTQSLLQLKNEYCNQKKCLQCSIGLQLLKN